MLQVYMARERRSGYVVAMKVRNAGHLVKWVRDKGSRMAPPSSGADGSVPRHVVLCRSVLGLPRHATTVDNYRRAERVNLGVPSSKEKSTDLYHL